MMLSLYSKLSPKLGNPRFAKPCLITQYTTTKVTIHSSTYIGFAGEFFILFYFFTLAVVGGPEHKTKQLACVKMAGSHKVAIVLVGYNGTSRFTGELLRSRVHIFGHIEFNSFRRNFSSFTLIRTIGVKYWDKVKIGLTIMGSVINAKI